MPALTHGRVKNGFSGPNRKLLASNTCPPGGLVVVKKNCGMGDAQRRGARIGGIGSRSASVRAAIRRRIPRENVDQCKK
tara:strand:+ start:166 stop:402 length:237 start_codon:yes stop_codon:yes gene_type:complete